jgi:hypothetical protein
MERYTVYTLHVHTCRKILCKCLLKSKSNTNSKPPQSGIGIPASGHGLFRHCPAMAVLTVGDDDLIKCPGLWVKKVLRSREIVRQVSEIAGEGWTRNSH